MRFTFTPHEVRLSSIRPAAGPRYATATRILTCWMRCSDMMRRLLFYGRAGNTLVTLRGVGFDLNAEVACAFDDRVSVATVLTLDALICAAPSMSYYTRVGVSLAATELSFDNVSSHPLVYEYYDQLTLRALEPRSGPGAGGTLVTVLGSYFRSVVDISCIFSSMPPDNGSVDVVPASLVNLAMVRCVTPPRQEAVVRLQVGVDQADASTTWLPFTYHERCQELLIESSLFPFRTSRSSHINVALVFIRTPIANKIVPTSGPLSGGTYVTIHGSGFQKVAATSCWFGNVSTPAYFVSSYIVTCTSTPGQGSVRVMVKSAHHDRNDLTNKEMYSIFFTFFTQPQIFEVLPSHNFFSTRSVLVMMGKHLPKHSTCSFENLKAAPSTRITSNLVLCPAPTTWEPRKVDIALRATSSQLAMHARFTFTIEPSPALQSISPALGPDRGGTIITLKGSNFGADSRCSLCYGFGGHNGSSACPPASSLITQSVTVMDIPSTRVDSSQLLCVSPPNPSSDQHWWMLVSSANARQSSAKPYRYISQCALKSLTPQAGPEAGSNTLRISGTNFVISEQPSIKLDGTIVQGTVVDSSTVSWLCMPQSHEIVAPCARGQYKPWPNLLCITNL